MAEHEHTASPAATGNEHPDDVSLTTLDLDGLDELHRKLAQLSALLQHCHGNSSEAFRNLNDELQERILWNCADLAGDAYRLALRIQGDAVA